MASSFGSTEEEVVGTADGVTAKESEEAVLLPRFLRRAPVCEGWAFSAALALGALSASSQVA